MKAEVFSLFKITGISPKEGITLPMLLAEKFPELFSQRSSMLHNAVNDKLNKMFGEITEEDIYGKGLKAGILEDSEKVFLQSFYVQFFIEKTKEKEVLDFLKEISVIES